MCGEWPLPWAGPAFRKQKERHREWEGTAWWGGGTLGSALPTALLAPGNLTMLTVGSGASPFPAEVI